MIATEKTYFNRLWLTDSEFSAYHCKVCEKSNDLGKMGKSDLWKHVKTDMHKRNMKDKSGVQIFSTNPSLTPL